MVPLLPTAISTAVKFPEEATRLEPAAIFQLGRLASSYENRAWAREKVKQAKLALSQVIDKELCSGYCDDEASTSARAQVKDREQVLMSLERFYKKQRHQTCDNFPKALPIMEAMIPGSTNGLTPKVALVIGVNEKTLKTPEASYTTYESAP